MSNDTTSTIGRSARHFFSGTILSRFTGMARDVTMAALFGSSPAVAAFMIAFRLSNLLRRLLGEGALQAAFIPHYERVRHDTPEKAASFFRDISASLTLCLVVIVIIAEAMLLGSIQLFSPSPASKDIIILTALMMPGVIFICLYGLSTALLQCNRHYFVASLSPAAFNGVWIIAVIIMRKQSDKDAMLFLAASVVIAFATQWLITIPGSFSSLKPAHLFRAIRHASFFSRELIPVARALAFGVVGVAASQINNGLDALFAHAADPEGPAYLWYALRLQQLPLALFGIAITGALLPPLSRAIKAGDIKSYQHFLQYGIKRTIALMLPATALTIVAGASSVNLIYGHGNFDASATLMTSRCLFAYALGLIPITGVILFSSAFYAFQNYRTPTIITLFAVMINISLNTLFVFGLHWGAVSIAIATSISAWINAALLAALLIKHHTELFSKQLVFSIARVMGATLCATIIATSISNILPEHSPWTMMLSHHSVVFSRTFVIQIRSCLSEIIAFFITLLITAKMVKARDILDMIKLIK